MAKPLDEQTDEELETALAQGQLDERKAAGLAWTRGSRRRAGSLSHQKVAQENLNAASPSSVHQVPAGHSWAPPAALSLAGYPDTAWLFKSPRGRNRQSVS